jgi:methylthioribulose-1-phosphate dehydratase
MAHATKDGGTPGTQDLRPLATELAELSRWAHARGWVPATSGNFSASVSTEPFRLAITASGRDKSTLAEADVVMVDEAGRAVESNLKPSAEVLIHILVARARRAGAIAHVHSLWGTLVSEMHHEKGRVEFEGLELLKALDGVGSHEHREVVPIVENTQDWAAAAPELGVALAEHPSAHGFLIRGHGLYTWARDVAGVRRHLEAFEYLFELEARRRGPGPN